MSRNEILVSGSLGENENIQLSEEELYLFQIQRDMLLQASTMITKHQQRTMDPSEEQKMFQFLIDSGYIWSENLPEKYAKQAKELIEKKKIYLN